MLDVTGSMWDDLQQLKNGAEKIMKTMEEREDNPIYNYILVPFHDPSKYHSDYYQGQTGPTRP